MVMIVLLNFFAPLFFLNHVEARWALVAGMSAAVIFMILHRIQGLDVITSKTGARNTPQRPQHSVSPLSMPQALTMVPFRNLTCGI